MVVFEFIKYLLLKNVGIGVFLMDELFGVFLSKIVKGELINDCWMNGLNIMVYVSWIIVCMVGVIFGYMLLNLEVFGFDFVLIVMFLVLFVL